MLEQHSIHSSTVSNDFCWKKDCNCLGADWAVQVYFFFCEEPRSRGPNEFEQTQDILAIAGDGLAYGVACLQFLDSSLEAWHFVRNDLLESQFFSAV